MSDEIKLREMPHNREDEDIGVQPEKSNPTTEKVTSPTSLQEAIEWASDQRDRIAHVGDVGSILLLNEADTHLQTLIQAAQDKDMAIDALEECVRDCDTLLEENTALKSRIKELEAQRPGE